MQSLKYLILVTAAGAAIGQEQAAQSVFRNVFTNLTSPAASPALRNVGQTNHTLIVKVHTGSAQLGGLVCRLEASTDNAAWFPIAVDVTFLPSIGTPPAAYAIVKGNGVYPYLRVDCPTVPASPGLDVAYIGSQYPYGDVSLAGDRYLTTSVGGSVARLAAPPEPTSTDGLTSGSWITVCPQDYSCSATGFTANGNDTMTFTQPAGTSGSFGYEVTVPAAYVLTMQAAPAWTKVVLKLSAYTTTALGTGSTWKGLILRDPTTLASIVFSYFKDSITQGSFSQGGTNKWYFRVQNTSNAGNFYAGGSGKILLTSASLGATESPTVCLSVSKSGTDLTFSYSLDCVSFSVLGTQTYAQYSALNSGTPAFNLTQLGMFGDTQNFGASSDATFPLSFTVSRFKFY